jgi:hypothetical protein
MANTIHLHHFAVNPVALAMFAAYSCGTYGAGSYNTCSTATVGAPNTGFPPLDMLQSIVSNSFFLPVISIALLIVGIVVIYAARRRSRSK